ncbi:MAG: RecX family transcriptional regulator [Bacilli bacterium]|nr:RecX family transcriptional regulator [Bacilli bacterium]
MKIKKISKVGADKYSITLDNDEKILTYDDVILKYRLLPGSFIDMKLLTNIQLDTNIDKTYYKIVKMISKKLKSKSEIINYLDKLQIESYEKQIIIDKLVENKLIDDRRFAKAFVYDRFNLSSDGPNLIRKKLNDLLIEPSYIDESLSTVKVDDVKSKLDKFMNKKISNNNKYSDYILKQKVYTHFMNLGYSSEDIIESFEKNKKKNNTIDQMYNKFFQKFSKKYSDEELKYKIKDKLYKLGYNSDEISNVLKKNN